MRNVFAFCLAAAIVAASPALAAGVSMPDVQKPQDIDPKVRLDKLFADLKRERNEKAAERISQRINAEWAKSGSATVDLMMGWVAKAAQKQQWDVALDFLDQITVMKPDYAEAWNRRATIHFMMGNYSKSMSDIERTLELEPRHFGALSGLGDIMKSRGSKQLALQAYERVLAVYPMLRGAQNEVAAIADELAGQGI